MVHLTITMAMVEAMAKVRGLQHSAHQDQQSRSQSVATGEQSMENEQKRPIVDRLGTSKNESAIQEKEASTDRLVGENVQDGIATTARATTEPSLEDPIVGNPISHAQILDLSKNLKVHGILPCSLEVLLKGARVYIPSPPPKAEPTIEYKALMARLRREEEARSYDRLINPSPPMETFTQRFPASSAAHAFSDISQSINTSDPDDDGLTFADVDRQMALILNVLLSIVACAAAIWMAARWWSTPARLAVSMSGGALVGVAEVVVYLGYLRRVGEAKGKEEKVKEVKEVMKTWAVGAGARSHKVVESEKEILMDITPKENSTGDHLRRR